VVEASVEEEEAEGDEAAEEVTPEQLAADARGTEVGVGMAPQRVDTAGVPVHGQPAAAPAVAGNVAAFSGHSGSRKNKKHKRRHH